MKKPNFLSRILLGFSLLFATLSQAQTSSGYTHATNIYQDCYYGYASWDGDFSISVYTGGHANFRVITTLYRGDWTIAGMGHVVSNDVAISTSTSSVYYYFPFAIMGVPLVFNTASFYSTPPSYTVYRNGTYRMTTTLQKQIGGVWTDIFTTPLSSAYGVIDVPPYPTYGDFNELALITDLNTGGNFNYKINGLEQVGSSLSFITCPAVDLVIDNVTDWQQNPGTATLTVETGSLVGSVFYPSTSSYTTFAVDGANKNLTSMFSLGSYSGALRVNYRLPDDECYGTYTQVSKTMTLSVSTASFSNNYLAPTGSAVIAGCASTLIAKPVSTTWSIAAAMPSSTVSNTFKCQLKTATGWQGATSAGIADLTYSGDYSIDVYEVSPSTGVRLSGAPSLYLKTGTAASNDQVEFREFGYSAGFDASNPPYYVDATVPADPLGAGAGYGYFIDFYSAARTSSATVGNLTSFSARVFCAEVSQQYTGGCVVSKKSYFRIANNGLASGGVARMATTVSGEVEEEYVSLDVYPNPTKGELTIPVSEDDTNVSMIIMDNLGKQVMTFEDVKAKGGIVNIEHLSPGIYFYTINKDHSVYRGKIIKQ